MGEEARNFGLGLLVNLLRQKTDSSPTEVVDIRPALIAGKVSTLLSARRDQLVDEVDRLRELFKQSLPEKWVIRDLYFRAKRQLEECLSLLGESPNPKPKTINLTTLVEEWEAEISLAKATTPGKLRPIADDFIAINTANVTELKLLLLCQ